MTPRPPAFSERTSRLARPAGLGTVVAMRSVFCLGLGLLVIMMPPGQAAPTNTTAAIAAVFQADRELDGMPLSTVIEATTGRKIIPINLEREPDRELIRALGVALDEVLRRLNATNSPAQRERRINEVSSHFENELKTVLNATPGFACDFPRTAAGKIQRSGYPDLRVVDEKSGAIAYVDPKLFEHGSRASTFRTFYYEPKIETSKIHDDAHHLIVGIEHDGRASGAWQFLNWELVDVSGLRVKLKAEFQSNNKELYRHELIVGTSRKETNQPPRSSGSPK
jgi:hypothetical protein